MTTTEQHQATINERKARAFDAIASGTVTIGNNAIYKGWRVWWSSEGDSRTYTRPDLLEAFEALVGTLPGGGS